jgi:hypothetical protein
MIGLTFTVAGSAFAAAPPNPTQVGATTLSNIQLNDVPGTVLTVTPGANITISANWSDSNTGCPGCIDFLTVGWPGQNFAGCIENPGFNGDSGSGSVNLGPAPTAGGTYDIVAHFEEVYYCGEYWNTGSSVDYQVIAQVVVPSPPTASIETPVSGATYAQGSVVDSAFTCTDGTGGTGIASCLDQNGHTSGTAVDTSTMGTHTFGVIATSNDGLSGTASVTYDVVPTGSFAASAPTAPLDLTVTCETTALSWKAPVFSGGGPVTSYEVFGFTSGTVASLIATVSGTSYVDSNVTVGVTYSYYVEAVNAYGVSSPSNVVSATATSSGSAAFVCALYEDLLGRVPEPGGLSFWQSALSSGMSTTQVAWDIATSNEYRTDYIKADYEALLGRAADPGGLYTWLAAFNSGASDEQISAGIVGSAEFFSDAGSTNSGFIDAVYQDLLGRAADPGGLWTWDSDLSSGLSRTQIAYDIDTSNESRTDTVQSFYKLLLNRPADPGGLWTWVAALNSGATDEQVLAGIAGSQEFYSDATGA